MSIFLNYTYCRGVKIPQALELTQMAGPNWWEWFGKISLNYLFSGKEAWLYSELYPHLFEKKSKKDLESVNNKWLKICILLAMK